MRRNFDEIDVSLLYELQLNASRSIKQLSAKAPTSLSNIHRRREEFRSDGVIIGVTAQSRSHGWRWNETNLADRKCRAEARRRR